MGVVLTDGDLSQMLKRDGGSLLLYINANVSQNGSWRQRVYYVSIWVFSLDASCFDRVLLCIAEIYHC